MDVPRVDLRLPRMMEQSKSLIGDLRDGIEVECTLGCSVCINLHLEHQGGKSTKHVFHKITYSCTMLHNGVSEAITRGIPFLARDEYVCE